MNWSLLEGGINCIRKKEILGGGLFEVGAYSGILRFLISPTFKASACVPQNVRAARSCTLFEAFSFTGDVE